MHHRDQVHAYLKKQFRMPDYQGNNLDALWDVLYHNQAIEKITIIHSNTLISNLGQYGESLIKLFSDLQEMNSIELNLYKEHRINETK